MPHKKRNSRSRQQVAEEDVPLMPQGQLMDPEGNHGQDSDESYDDSHWLDVIVNPDRHNKGTALIVVDAVLLILQYLQLYALLQSLAIRWPWPENWLSWSSFIFFANLDIWEFLKLYGNGVFHYVQDYFVPSADMRFDYMYLMAAWGIILFLFLVIYIGCYLGFTRRKSPRMLIRQAVLKHVLIIAVQILAIPVGIFLFRLLHCTDDHVVDVKNEIYCFYDTHWAYVAPALVILFLIFVIFPAWLIIRTKDELLSMNSDKHESYLQLKEMEYIHGLDVVWVVGNFHIFASFKKSGAHFRACVLIMHGVLLIIYGTLFRYPFIQAVLLNFILFAMFLAFLILRPYRIGAYNIMLIVNYLCLSSNCLLGSFKTGFSASTTLSPWLVPNYTFILLGVTNGFWLLCMIIFLLYIVARMSCCKKQGGTLWPYTKFEKICPDTRKYVKGIIIARLLVEKTLAMHVMFAPIHEVARYIHIINAYCREAEYTNNPMQNTLWDVLNELIEIHTSIAPRCLFAESTKDSIRKTAAEFLTLMPLFVRRLAQREYDFILVSPVKRRIILKLYCLSLLMRGRRIDSRKNHLTVPAIKKLWHKESEEESDPGYFEDMYPPKEPMISQRIHHYDADVLIQLEDEEDEENEAILQETEEWLMRHGIGNDRPAAPDIVDQWLVKLRGGDDEDIPEINLPKDITIPGMTYVGSSVFGTDTESIGGSRPSMSIAHVPEGSRTASTVSLQAVPQLPNHPAPSLSSKPNSAGSNISRLTDAGGNMQRPPSSESKANPVGSSSPRPPSAASLRPSTAGFLRPSSAGSPRPSTAGSLRPSTAGSLRPSTAGSLRPVAVEESLPGAIVDDENQSTSRPASAAQSLKNVISSSGSRPGSGNNGLKSENLAGSAENLG